MADQSLHFPNLGGGAGNAVEDAFSPTPGQTVFTLSSTPNSSAAFALYLNGQLRQDIVDYTVSGTTLTWLDPNGLTLVATDILQARYNNSVGFSTLWNDNGSDLRPVSSARNLVLPSGDLGLTGSRVTKIWATDIESTNMPTVGGTSINANAVLSLTVAEVSQLANIDSVTISNAQWVYLGELDQALKQTDSVQFDDLTLSGLFKPSISSVIDIDSSSGITSIPNSILQIQSQTAGETVISANPRIVAGVAGQPLWLIGADDIKTVTFQTGNGLKLNNGQPFTLGKDDVLKLIYTGSFWVEESRSNNG